MATILENESAWSTTAATNANVDTGIGWPENQDPASVNNSARGMMSARAKARLDQGGALVAGGSANALTVTTNQVLSAAHLAAGQRLLVRATAANTSSTVTFAPDSLTARNIKRCDGSALVVGSIKSGMMLDLVYNAGSSEWRAANIAPATSHLSSVVIQRFTASGTYTPTTGMLYCIIECVGAGGGGGGCNNTAAGVQHGAGGGGGGSYSRVVKTAAQIGASQLVTVPGSATGGTNAPTAGSAGGDAFVGPNIAGALCSGKGGSGGASASGGALGLGGDGGVPGVGDFSVPGQDGSRGSQATINTVHYPAGNGGSAGLGFGGGAPGVNAVSAGIAGTNYGGGGSGGHSNNAGGGGQGGAGAQGIVIITEYC